MKPETSVITIRVTKADKEAIADMAWKQRRTVTSLFDAHVKKLAKQAKD